MIDLAKFENGHKYKGDYEADLFAVQDRLARAQVAHIVHGRSAIVVLEGWDASGKGGIIQRMTGRWDPRHYKVWPISAPSAEEAAHHFLWRFWNRLPGKGQIAVFDRSWYGRVLVERVEGYAAESEWRRGYDEINAFEAQQIAHGTTIVKLFPHVSAKVQDKRLRARIEHPWKRWKTGAEDFRNRARREDYLVAMAEMFERTDTEVAPWTVIDGNNKKAARIAALTHVAERLEAAVDMTPPPIDEAVAELARGVWGKKVDV
ncbi:polyphosphate kinase 2 family protein [Sphingomonas sp. ID0503]|uniref:polyphosphate kinase 2 family protein n=1 Tax=Sphingomonas sp. ID0503 TaxID=3399691 RepID=UPI003AFA1CBF